jgi:hypothetical protein
MSFAEMTDSGLHPLGGELHPCHRFDLLGQGGVVDILAIVTGSKQLTQNLVEVAIALMGQDRRQPCQHRADSVLHISPYALYFIVHADDASAARFARSDRDILRAIGNGVGNQLSIQPIQPRPAAPITHQRARGRPMSIQGLFKG